MTDNPVSAALAKIHEAMDKDAPKNWTTAKRARTIIDRFIKALRAAGR